MWYLLNINNPLLTLRMIANAANTTKQRLIGAILMAKHRSGDDDTVSEILDVLLTDSALSPFLIVFVSDRESIWWHDTHVTTSSHILSHTLCQYRSTASSCQLVMRLIDDVKLASAYWGMSPHCINTPNSKLVQYKTDKTWRCLRIVPRCLRIVPRCLRIVPWLAVDSHSYYKSLAS